MTLRSYPMPLRISFALAVVLCSWLPCAARAKILVGPDLGNAFLPTLFPVSLAVLEDGSFALAGTTSVAASHGGDEEYHAQFVVQTYSPSGRPQGAPFMPQLAATPPADNGGIGSLGDHYFVSWQHHANQTSRATMLGERGQVLTAPFAFPNSAIDFYTLYERYGHAPSWHFLPSFYYDGGIGPITGEPISQARVQAYGSDGRPIGVPVALGPRPGWVFIDDLAISGNGAFVVASKRCTEDFSSCADGVQLFKKDGLPSTPFVTFGVPTQTIGIIATGIAPNGDFVLVWDEEQNGMPELFLRLFDRRSVALTDAIGVAVVPQGGFFRTTVRAHGNSFVLAWTLIKPNDDVSDSDDFYLSEFLTASRRLTPPVLLAHSDHFPQPTGSNNISGPGYTFEMNDSGHGILAWSTFDENLAFTGHLRLITVQGDRSAEEANGDR
jgi:hypothetical protein